MDIITNQSRGLHTAWLLSTLGSKTSSRNKIIRKDDLLNILIPELCKELINCHRDSIAGVNIRFSSNVLHGISILYGSKITHVLSEVTHVQLRLQNAYFQLSTKRCDQLMKHDGARGLKRADFLENDYAFYVEHDLMQLCDVSGLEIEDNPDTKRRKLEIAELDLREFTIFDNTGEVTSTSGGAGLGPFGVAIDDHMEMDFSEASLALPNAHRRLVDDELVNLQFNEDGEILEIGQPEVTTDLSLLVGKEVELSRRLLEDDSVERVASYGGSHSTEEENFDVAVQDLVFQAGASPERQHPNLQATGSTSFRIPKRKIVIDENTSLTRESIINHYDSYATIMKYKSSFVPQRRQVQQVYQELNMTNFRPWANGNNGIRNSNSSSIEESINRTMGIFHRTEIMANEASEQARNSQLAMEVERSRILQSYDDDELSGNLEEIGHRNSDGVETHFDATVLDLDFNFDDESRLEEREQEGDGALVESSSFSLSSDDKNLQPNLTPRLKKLIKYFVQRLVDLGKSNNSQGKECVLTFTELVPVRDENEINTKKIAAGVFSSILFLANKNIVSISVEPHKRTEINLVRSDDIKLTLHAQIAP